MVFLGLSAPVKDVKVSPKDGKLWVEWTPANDNANKYIIEWCEQCDSSRCSFEWQQEPGTAQGSFLRGNPEESWWIPVCRGKWQSKLFYI